VEKPHREDGVEVIVGKREPAGIALHERQRVGDAGPAGLLAALFEHRLGDVHPDDVGAPVGKRDGEPAGAAGDFEDPPVLDGTERVEHRLRFSPIDEPSAAGEPLVVVRLRDVVFLVPLLSLHSVRIDPPGS